MCDARLKPLAVVPHDEHVGGRNNSGVAEFVVSEPEEKSLTELVGRIEDEFLSTLVRGLTSTLLSWSSVCIRVTGRGGSFVREVRVLDMAVLVAEDSNKSDFFLRNSELSVLVGRCISEPIGFLDA